MIVRVPPDSLVDVDVLNEEGYQKVDEEQEFKEKAPIQWQVRDPAVTHRLWSNQCCDRRRRQADGTTIPEADGHHLLGKHSPSSLTFSRIECSRL